MNPDETPITHEDFNMLLGLMEQLVANQEAITDTQNIILRRITKAAITPKKNAEYRNK
jgi:hypothetical protein